jgi:hypothetical protein
MAAVHAGDGASCSPPRSPAPPASWCWGPLLSLHGDDSAAEPSRAVSFQPRAPGAAPPPPAPLALRAIQSTGRLATVPGSGPASSGSPATLYAVEAEQGVDVDRGAFDREVERTLGDLRGRSLGARPPLRRNGGSAALAFCVTLAGPATTDRLCAPLLTRSTYPCHQGGRAVLNAGRWARGARAYGADLSGYRRYMVNHEVGHALDHGHAAAPARATPHRS